MDGKRATGISSELDLRFRELMLTLVRRAHDLASVVERLAWCRAV
jgi:hypothetical protein